MRRFQCERPGQAGAEFCVLIEKRRMVDLERSPAAVPRVSVVMPTFEQSAFLPRAVESLRAQSLMDWELIIVDDGSHDATSQVVAPYLTDRRVRFHRLADNVGLGAALNEGLDLARAPLIAYLPSDDVYHQDHLQRLCALLHARDDAVLAYAGVRHHYNREALGVIEGYPLQLVQVVHRRTDERWMTRRELVTDDLERMFWSRLRPRGAFVGSGFASCEWVDHPDQLHKVIREPEGGINTYRQRYRVRHPLRFHSTMGNFIDEAAQYGHYRERAETPPSFDRLKILLVGELAYNADRVLALEELGHKLYGLWMPKPYWYNAVGPLPFGHVEDIPAEHWRDAVKRVAPDVIYALLNWQAVPFAHEVLEANPGVPFVWHFKEGPFICLEKGTWPQLMDLYARADGQIYSSPEMRDWFDTLGMARRSDAPRLVLDGDLPKADWFAGEPSPRLPKSDGEIHTVVPGRPIGLHPPDVAKLADQGIHLHFYGDFTHGQWRGWIEKASRLAPRHLHLHANVDQAHWLREFSRYDAGWLHFFRSENGGDYHRANWDDLNYPARLGTFAAAGLPVLQRDNRGSVVATQRLAEELGIGICVEGLGELGGALRERGRLERARQRMWQVREQFTFDYHAGRLIDFFRLAIAHADRGSRRSARLGADPLS